MNLGGGGWDFSQSKSRIEPLFKALHCTTQHRLSKISYDMYTESMNGTLCLAKFPLKDT